MQHLMWGKKISWKNIPWLENLRTENCTTRKLNDWKLQVGNFHDRKLLENFIPRLENCITGKLNERKLRETKLNDEINCMNEYSMTSKNCMKENFINVNSMKNQNFLKENFTWMNFMNGTRLKKPLMKLPLKRQTVLSRSNLVF